MAASDGVSERKFGVNVGSRLAEKIEAPLQFGDSRAQRIRHLVRLGLAADKALGHASERDIDEKERMVKQAVRDYRRDD